MRSVFKYPLAITDEQSVLMPEGSEILSVQFQYDTLCAWAAVDTLRPMEVKTIRILGTGHPLHEPSRLRFLGTVQQWGGQLVWHVFEQTPS